MPAVYNWSELGTVTVFGGGGANPPSFNPAFDRLHFDDPSIAAASLDFSSPLGAASVFQYGGKYILLDTPPYTLTTGNITFADGSMLWYGDNNTTGPAPDDAGNVIVAVSGDDFLVGAGGNDQLFGGDGNDRLLVTFGSTGTAYGNDTIDGGAGGHDRVVFGEALSGVFVTMGNEAMSGSIIGGDAGSFLTISGIEAVSGTAFADTFNANEHVQVNGLRTDIVQRFEGGAGNDSIAAGMNGGWQHGITIIAEYRNDPGGIIVNLDQQHGQPLIVGAETIEAGTARDGYGDVDTLMTQSFGPNLAIVVDGIVGSMYDDYIQGGAFANSIGGNSRQIFEGLGGNDTIIGGHDFGGAIASYESSTQAVIVNLRETAVDLGGGDAIGAMTARDGFGGTDTLAGMDGARGSKHNDTLIGGTNDEEHFTGLGGDDYIDGGDDFDNAYYTNAEEAVLIHLGAGVLGVARALDGVDETGTIGVDELVEIEAAHGSDFNDSIVGGGDGAQEDEFEDVEGWEIDLFLGVEEFQGYAGDDIIDGGDGPAGPGNPRDFALYRDSAGSVIVNLGTGTVGGVGPNRASDGFGGMDTLIDIDGAEGSRFDDTLIGGDGSNYFIGRQGNDFLDGGAGIDWISFDFGNRVEVDLSTGTATEFQGGGGMTWTDTFVGFENVVGSGGDDRIIGNAQRNVLVGFESDDTIFGGGGNDTLIGGEDDDTLNGGGGADSMVGGEGDDTYFVDNVGDRVVEAAGGGNDTVITSVSMALPRNVENIIFTGGAGIIISGNAQANIIGGGASNDTLSGGAGIDTVSYALANKPVTVNLETGTATGYGNDVLSDFENATGGSAADRLIGNSANNVLDGSGGADTMTGGFGNDTYHIDRATDKVIETSNSLSGALLLPDGDSGPGLAGVSGITDTVVAAITYSLSTNALRFVENLTLTNSAARGTGNALANKITGNDGNNRLDGKDGNDVINGGAGNDSLNGGAGTDRLNGGAGDDILIWASTDTHDGAAGTDTLKVLSGNLDLTAVLNSRIKNIEQIDMTGSNSNTLTVTAEEVLAISSTTDTLTVLGNDGDLVNVAGFVQGADSGGFRTYTSGSAVLLVDQDLNVVI